MQLRSAENDIILVLHTDRCNFRSDRKINHLDFENESETRTVHPVAVRRHEPSYMSSVYLLPYDVGPARAFLGEAEKTPCGLGPASRVNVNTVKHS